LLGTVEMETRRFGEIHMNSFTLTAVGNLARNPEAVAKGDVTYTRFCLVGNDYAGKDEEGAPREIVTSLWFVAFGWLGESIVRNTRKGDQLIVEARVRANNWTDKQGEKQYDHDFVVQGFRFGAPGKVKREEREQRREETLEKADTKPSVTADVKPSNDIKPGDAEANVSQGAAGKNGAGAANLGHDKPNGQRAGRRAPAPP
jgi:single-strand DNA-binding protein